MLKDLPAEESAQLVEYMNKVNSGREDDDDDVSLDEFNERMDRGWQ